MDVLRRALSFAFFGSTWCGYLHAANPAGPCPILYEQVKRLASDSAKHNSLETLFPDSKLRSHVAKYLAAIDQYAADIKGAKPFEEMDLRNRVRQSYGEIVDFYASNFKKKYRLIENSIGRRFDFVNHPYFSEKMLAEMEVTVYQSRLVYLNSKIVVDGELMNFVMWPDGRIFVHDSKRFPGDWKHTSLSMGLPVASAGRMSVEKGRLLQVDNHSGHFQPAIEETTRVLVELAQRAPGRGLDVSGTKTASFQHLGGM